MDEITVKVKFLGEVRSIAKRRDMEVTLAEGSTVGDLLHDVSRTLGGAFASHLFGQDGTIHPHVSVFVNGSDIKELAGLKTELAGGDVDVLVLPIFSGG